MKNAISLKNISLRSFMALAMILLVFAATASLTFVGLTSLQSSVDSDIQRRTHENLRTAVSLLRAGLPHLAVEANASGEPDRLVAQDADDALKTTQPFEQIVDQISWITRGTATVFQWDEGKKDFVRIATTVKKPDGTRAVGTVLGVNGVVYPFMLRKEPYRGIANILGEPYQTGYLPIIAKDGKPVGILYIGVGKLAELEAAVSGFKSYSVVLGLVVLALAALLVIVLAGWLLRPLDQVALATGELAAGKDSISIPHLERVDQIGIIARAVETFRAAVIGQRAVEQDRQNEAARIQSRKDEMDALVRQFRTTIAADIANLKMGNNQIQETSSEIHRVVAAAGGRVADGREAVESGTLAISDVAAATSQFLGSISEIAARTSDAAGIVSKAAESGAGAERVVADLSSVVERITNAVSIISSIAEQTNLLALNATIEAARAGEAGRGFAVVASEVKELSGGTAKAAAEIVDLVRSIQGVTGAVTEATKGIGVDLQKISDTTMVIAAAVTEQEQVTQNIANNANMAARGSDVIREGFAAIDTAIRTTAESADALDTIAQSVANTAESVITSVEDFLNKMAA